MKSVIKMYEKYLTRKEKIIITAIEILDELGLQRLTTKEIAKRQGVTEPAIYRQFNNKQEIVSAIIDRFSVFDEMIRNTIVEQKMLMEQGILYFIESYSDYYQNYPQITTVFFSFGFFHYEENTNQKMIKIMQERRDFLESLIKKGIQEKNIKLDIEAQMFADMLLGMMWSTLYVWKTTNEQTNFKETLMQKITWLLARVII